MDWITLAIVSIGLLVVAWFAKPWQGGLPGVCLFLVIAYATTAMVLVEVLVIRNPFITVMGLLALAHLTTTPRIRWHGVARAVLAFAGMSAIASALGINPLESLLRFLGLSFMVAIACYFCIAHPKPAAIIPRIARWQIGMGLVLVLVLVRYVVVGELDFQKRFQLSDYVVATGTAGVAFFAGIAAASAALDVRHRSWRVVLMAGWAVTQLSVYASGTRGTLIAALLAAPIVLLPGVFRGGLRSRALLSCVVVAVGILVAFEAIRGSEDPALASTRTFLRLDREDVLDTRRDLWAAAVDKGMERPWLGRGMGSSSFFWMDDESMEDRSAEAMRETGRVTVHNQFVEVFYESGFLGLCLFVGLSVHAGFGALRWLEFGLKRHRMECIFLGLSWLGMGLGMFSHGGLTTSGNPGALLFWLNTVAVGCRPERVFAMAKHRGTKLSHAKGPGGRRQARRVSTELPENVAMEES